MPVVVRGQQFYTKAEVAAMSPAASIDSNWETTKLTLKNGYAQGWSQNVFHANKRTGLITGVTGISSIATATGWNYATEPDLATHSLMAIRYSGQLEYGACATTASDTVKAGYCNLNTNIDANGNFNLQGIPATEANRSSLGNIIESFAYIGSKYGKITDTDVKVVYMQEGTFYDANSADLINGKAWLRTRLTLPTGYSSSSYVYIYKNLWSGECIVQYSLYPSTVGTTPSIALPERFRLIKRNNAYPTIYIPVRYREGISTTATSSNANHNIFMCLSSTISFNAPTLTWMTGSYFYQGNPETRPQQNTSESVIGLWMPDAPANAVPSVNNNCWANGYDEVTAALDSFWDTGYTARANPQSWVSYNQRTGMVYNYFDFTTTGTTLPSQITKSSLPYDIQYLPSYRYNSVANTSQRLYCGVNGYIQYSKNLTELTDSEWTANMSIGTCPSLGTAPAAASRVWSYGTPGVTRPIANNLSCYSAYYLGGSTGNVRA